MDGRKVFRELIQIDEAWQIFFENIPQKIQRTEKIRLEEALNRVIIDDIFSEINVPPFDRVLMDGYAVNSSEIQGALEDNPVTLEKIGGIKAGHVFEGKAREQTCVEVSTGSPMPYGYDSVVMVEYTEENNSKIRIYRATSPSENIMAAGSDIRRGELILRANTILTPRDLAILAALGITHVEVYEIPKIGIFSSGDEIVPLGKELPPGKIYDINSTMIHASILENGGLPQFLGILSDTYEDIYNGISKELGKYDLIIISGGTSAGMGDMLYKVIEDIGEPGLLVHGIKVKPGKPTILGSCKNTPIIGLPGNPASALSIMHLLVIKYIRHLAGLNPIPPEGQVSAVIRQKIRSTPGRHEFKPVNLVSFGDEIVAFPVPGGSGAITSIGLADGFIQIPEGVSFLNPNDKIEVTLISSSIALVDLQIIGAYDVLLNKILREFSKLHPEIRVRFIPTSSSGGMASLKRGECHMASVTDVTDDVILSYSRNYGILFREGLGIRSINDLSSYSMVNYTVGSAYRKLFDKYVQPNMKGYDNVTKTVYSAIGLIQQGRADYTLGLQVDAVSGLNFLPLGEQTFSLIKSADSEVSKLFEHFLINLDLHSLMMEGYQP